MRDNFLQERTFDFAIKIIKSCRKMQGNGEFVISKQLLKSGTSVGANVREANYAVSRAEFISKLQIALKEAAETEYWLMLLSATDDNNSYGDLQKESTEIKRILVKSLITAKANDGANR